MGFSLDPFKTIIHCLLWKRIHFFAVKLYFEIAAEGASYLQSFKLFAINSESKVWKLLLAYFKFFEDLNSS